MSLRITILCVVLLIHLACLQAADTHFEVSDNEENSRQGIITTLDQSQVILNVQGTIHTIPLEKVVKIRNIAPNPYGVSSSGANNQDSPPISMAPRSTIRGENERKTAAQLESLQSQTPTDQRAFPNSVAVVELKDGSQLIAVSFTAAKNLGTFRLLGQRDNSSLPLNSISAVRFAVRSLSESLNPPTDWLRLAIPHAKGDRLVIGNAGSFDVYTGILNDVSAETISFAIDGEILPVPRRKVFGLILHNESPSVSGTPLGILNLWSGTKGMISDIHLRGNELTWQTSSGLTAVVPLEMVNEIDFGEKKMTYLTDVELVRSEFSLPFESDIKPAQLPILQTFYMSRTKNTAGEVIMDGTVYERSILLKGKTQLEYRLPKPFTSLKAVIGIEDQFRPYASATLQILADSQMLGTWTLRGDTSSQRILLNLPQHCRLITIIAGPPLQSDVPAVLTIADPKLFE